MLKLRARALRSAPLAALRALQKPRAFLGIAFSGAVANLTLTGKVHFIVFEEAASAAFPANGSSRLRLKHIRWDVPQSGQIVDLAELRGFKVRRLAHRSSFS
jgi:hypothetical protein